jgi:hypothetical protein
MAKQKRARHQGIGGVWFCSRVVAGPAGLASLGCAPGSHWVRIQILRLDQKSNGLPIGWTDTYVDLAYADVPRLLEESPKELISSLTESTMGRGSPRSSRESRRSRSMPNWRHASKQVKVRRARKSFADISIRPMRHSR